MRSKIPVRPLLHAAAAEPVLRLITCGGELDKAARSYRDNVVVSARLVV